MENKINHLKSFSSSGSFNREFFYVNLFDSIPSICTFESDKIKIDTKKLTIEKLRELFPDLILVRVSDSFSEVKTSSVKDYGNGDDEDDEIYIGGAWIDKAVVIAVPNFVWCIAAKQVTIYYNSILNPLNDVKELYKEIYEKLPKVEEKPKAAEVKLVAYDNGYYTISSKVNQIDLNVEECYNDDFIPVYKDILKFIDERSSGLIVLRGTKGTGNLFKIAVLKRNL